MQELIGYYITMEQYFMRETVNKVRLRGRLQEAVLRARSPRLQESPGRAMGTQQSCGGCWEGLPGPLALENKWSFLRDHILEIRSARPGAAEQQDER